MVSTVFCKESHITILNQFHCVKEHWKLIFNAYLKELNFIKIQMECIIEFFLFQL